MEMLNMTEDDEMKIQFNPVANVLKKGDYDGIIGTKPCSAKIISCIWQGLIVYFQNTILCILKISFLKEHFTFAKNKHTPLKTLYQLIRIQMIFLFCSSVKLSEGLSCAAFVLFITSNDFLIIILLWNINDGYRRKSYYLDDFIKLEQKYVYISGSG